MTVIIKPTPGQTGWNTAVDAVIDKVNNGVPVAPTGRSLTLLPGRLWNIKAQNAEPYSQDSVTTHNGVQYAVWVNDARNPIIGQRTLPHGEWATFDLSTVAGNPLAAPTVDDLHNNYVVAVDSTGFIHVSGNHHDSALRYIRSTTAGSITAWTAPGMVGTDENSATYPQFLRRGAELLFVYRNGASGNGDTFINVYNTGAKTWARRSQPFKGTAPVSPDESAYTNHLALDSGGVLHVFYMWRTTNDVSTTHDIKYVKSADGGVTWTNAAGAAVAIPIVPSSGVVDTLETGNIQQINQSGAAADAAGRPHAVWWTVQTNETKLVHYWYDGAAWHEDTEDTFGLSGIATLDLARPAVISYGGRTFVIFSREFNGHRSVWRCRDITPTVDGIGRLPEFTLYQGDLGSYEPSFDTRALDERGELHMLITPIQPTAAGVTGPSLDEYEQTWGALLSLDVNNAAAAASANPIPALPSENRWIGANEMYLASGTPTLSNTLGAPAWLMDPAATEVISGALFIPQGWRTFDVDMWWANTAAGTGDVVDQFRYVFRKAGNNMTAGEINLGNVTRAAGAQNITTVTTVATGITVMPNDQLWRFNYRRAGADVLDTLANETAVFGFVLRRTA